MMKKAILVSAAVMMSAALFAVDLVKDGRADGTIYVAEFDPEASPELLLKPRDVKMKTREARGLSEFSMAVKDFTDHVRRQTGAEIPVKVVKSKEEVKAPALVLGTLASEFGAEMNDKQSFDGYHIKVSDGIAAAGGNTLHGCRCAVYELLTQAGFDWTFPGEHGTFIPAGKTFSIAEQNREFIPEFATRAPWIGGGWRALPTAQWLEFRIFLHRQKFQQDYLLADPYMMIGGHVWHSLFKTYRKEFEADPSMLALIRKPDGSTERRGPQLETANAKTADLLIRYIRETFKKNNWPKDKTVCIGVGPADGSRFSVSPESMALQPGLIDPMSGLPDFTDGMILFVNTILEKTSGEFPNLHLGFYLYSTYAGYPKLYTPHPRLVIMIADINFSRWHGLCDRNSKTRNIYRSIMTKWGELHKKQGNKIFLRGFDYNLAEGIMPYSKIRILGEDLPFYKKIGVSGEKYNWSTTFANSAPSHYVQARMEWDMSLNWKKLLHDFCEHSFGKGAQEMEAYFLCQSEVQAAAGQEAGSFNAVHLIYDSAFVAKAQEHFKKALALAETDREKENIVTFSRPVEFLADYLAYYNAMLSFDFAKAKSIYDSMAEKMKKLHEENPMFISAGGYWKRFMEKPVDKAFRYTSGEYRFLQPLPERMKMAIDTNDFGSLMGLYLPEINDKAWPEYATWTSTFDAQGLAGYRGGSVWYRTRIDIPKELTEKPVGLFIGGADCIIEVWCNGHYIGSGTGYLTPFVFDLTGFLREKDNLIALRVNRPFNSELGTGGLMMPSFLFTGPRLEKRAPATEPLHEMLPGAGDEVPSSVHGK